jgi:hypothetical protein
MQRPRACIADRDAGADAMPNPPRKENSRTRRPSARATTIDLLRESRLSCSRNVAGRPSTRRTCQCHMRPWGGRKMIRDSLDRTTARRTAERLAGSIACDEMKRLRRIVGRRSWLSHEASCTGTIHAREREGRDSMKRNRPRAQIQTGHRFAPSGKRFHRTGDSRTSRSDRPNEHSGAPAATHRMWNGLL